MSLVRDGCAKGAICGIHMQANVNYAYSCQYVLVACRLISRLC